MNAAFILLLLFAPYSIGSITEITLDSKDLKQIDSCLLNCYFFIRTSNTRASSLELYLKEYGYKLGKTYICYSSEDPNASGKYENCNYREISPYLKVRVNAVAEYNYTIPFESNNFVIFRCSGKNPTGTLFAQCKTPKLSTLAIVLIVVACVIAVVVGIILIYRFCCRKRTNVGAGTAQPPIQPATGVSNSSFPLMEQNNTNNPNY